MVRLYVMARTTLADLRGRLVDRAGSERGGVAAEYALLIALIAIVIIAGATVLGLAISTKLQNVGDTLNGIAP